MELFMCDTISFNEYACERMRRRTSVFCVCEFVGSWDLRMRAYYIGSHRFCEIMATTPNTWQRKIVSIAAETRARATKQAISDSNISDRRRYLNRKMRCDALTRQFKTIQSTCSSFKFFPEKLLHRQLAVASAPLVAFTKKPQSAHMPRRTLNRKIFMTCAYTRKKYQMPSINLFIDTFGHRLLDSMILFFLDRSLSLSLSGCHLHIIYVASPSLCKEK